ncbi:glycine dehydrogenase (decarboxylating) alpha subunit [Desulforamulus reducens MI-1]|uniref:Probable glycine dehydrogenase (decarboxylating) subunit 1 n=1 Tax=Desulforamulus reducens (strain ATCC BAA-1160 / DSM 100696 / MI-1) TaxID=349161 RepID=GCSPA_DESRM|nr:aminomethyl-transferring glycine dehydrogenase subunit GcvPA [Desulforamulus reducens]A4J2F8.1 RecName: Full=Probable glycine dehydrogenase (decarboxylating) subunit 1; AltName: Full=Glycine cleavage system P-protein subunit 1; AltName: Full=Glycine decarboxylase subunit 1; AltName: Full=Glycine dehydrogenase (aminomethyl-transferring) subunit 1 [Desulforamulus reducens MI-1]ABO49261.1 glycine dehydrogenase (decarboxylating) alpha subunit [Desulforamulus reducens MI-1]
MKFIPHTDEERRQMLKHLAVENTDQLFKDIPSELRLNRDLAVEGGLSEMELQSHMNSLAGLNTGVDQTICFLGAGAYDHYIPSAVKHILSRSEFYTAYTPYQPEISQGVLQSIFEYQSMICLLTGMDAANASMYDGASALAEAALMACAVTRRDKVLVASTLHPEYREVVKTYLHGPGIEISEIAYQEGLSQLADIDQKLDKKTAAVLVQYPNFFGCIEDLGKIAEQAHAKGALLVVCVDPIALGILKSPGQCGADIVVGEGQSLGIPLSYGGPYLGFMACKDKYLRKMPGRIVGQTVDVEGRRGYVLTLQAREQHIRRDKATSNICSNQALCALAATVYLSLVGRQGFKQVAELCLQKTAYAKELLAALPGYQLPWQTPVFKEFVLKTKEAPEVINRELLKENILGGLDLGGYYPELAGHMLFCVTEKRSRREIELLAARLGAIS